MMRNKEDGIVWSQNINGELTNSFVLTFVALFGSTLLYLSLIFSPAKEDPTGKALQAWSRVGTWAILYVFVLTNWGLLLFMVSHSTLTVIDAGNLSQKFGDNETAYVKLGWPLGILG